jgi:Outer membrane protein beta-barrel domain
MKKTILFVVAALLFCFLVQSLFAQTAPPEMDGYGIQGTRELGLSGSIVLPTIFEVDGDSDDDGTTTVTLQPYFKYFFQDRIHAGAQLLVQSSTTDTDTTDSTNNVVVFSPSIGYTYPLSPQLQVDASINLGFASVTVESGGTTQVDESAFSYGFSLMALSPLSESAVVGFGVIYTWTTLDVDGTDISVLARIIPIQVSYYF